MATTIRLPDDVVYREINAGDTVKFITNFNDFQLDVGTFVTQLGVMVGDIDTALDETLQSAAQIRTATQSIYDDQVLPARNETESLRDETQQLRDQTQQLAIGDVAVTDLQPGTLTAEKDYVSVDSNGAVVKRNLVSDVRAQLVAGSESAKLSRYDLASAVTTTTLDLAISNEFRVSAGGARTLAFANEPASSSRSMTVIVTITGTGPVTWPSSIEWHGGTAPELGTSWTVVVLNWDGFIWRGVLGASR